LKFAGHAHARHTSYCIQKDVNFARSNSAEFAFEKSPFSKVVLQKRRVSLLSLEKRLCFTYADRGKQKAFN